MSCVADERRCVERAARALRDAVPTEAVDTLPPAKSPHDSWTLDAVVAASDGVPPEALRTLAIEGLTLRQSPPRGEYVSVVATP